MSIHHVSDASVLGGDGSSTSSRCRATERPLCIAADRRS